MNATKVVSIRLALETYQDILIECEAKGINVTEWLERQIVLAKRSKAQKAKLVSDLEDIIERWSDFPQLAKRKLNKVISDIRYDL
jgi:hypothetical protein